MMRQSACCLVPTLAGALKTQKLCLLNCCRLVADAVVLWCGRAISTLTQLGS